MVYSVDQNAKLLISGRFFGLFDLLSLLKALSQIEIGDCSEKEIIQKALTDLVRYLGLDRCSLFRLSEGKLR